MTAIAPTHRAVFPHGCKNSEAARLSKGGARLRRRAGTRALDSLAASERRGFHEVDGALCRTWRRSPSRRRTVCPSRRQCTYTLLLGDRHEEVHAAIVQCTVTVTRSSVNQVHCHRNYVTTLSNAPGDSGQWRFRPKAVPFLVAAPSCPRLSILPSSAKRFKVSLTRASSRW